MKHSIFFTALCLLAQSKVFAKRPVPHYFEYDKVQHQFLNKTITLPEDAPVFKDDFLTAKTLELKSYSQGGVGQDMIIKNLFDGKKNGFFIDLAANDWKILSNSLMLEHFYDWNGLCVEPNPEYLPGLLSNRKCKVYTNPASSSTGDIVKFNFRGVLGGMVGDEFDNKKVEEGTAVTELITVTLESILEHAHAPKVIDYFSLDVEGAEYHVISNFDFSKYTFLTMTIERPSAKVHHLLVKHGYRMVNVLCTFGDTLYAHHTLPNFVDVMNKIHDPSTVTKMWAQDYLKHPKWDGSYKPVHEERA